MHAQMLTHWLFAAQMGDSELPTSKRIEKQDAIISQLRNKLDIDLENFEKLR